MKKLSGSFILAALWCISTCPAGGQSWQQTNVHPSGYIIYDLAITNSGLLLSGSSGVFASSDIGTTWFVLSPFTYGIESILRTYPGTIFVATLQDGLWKTTNEGQSWTRIISGMTNSWIKKIVWNPTNGHLFAGGPGEIGGQRTFFRSFDDGVTWEFVNSPMDFYGIDGMAVSNQGYIFAGNRNGHAIYRSTDEGSTWTNVGLANQEIQTIEVDSNNIVYAGVWHAGVFRSTDLGLSWTQRSAGIENAIVYELAFSEGAIYAGTFQGIYKSTNSGQLWVPVGFQQTWVRALLILSDGTVIAGTDGCYLYKSTDNGNSWIEIGVGGMVADGIYALASFQGEKVLAGGFPRIYSSTNHGETWQWATITPALRGDIVSFLVHPQERLYAAGIRSGVYCSLNGGTSWSSLNNGLTNTDARALTMDSLGAIYVGTFGGGIFKSTDLGLQWFARNSGLSYLNIGSLSTAPNGDLFAGSYERGAFRSTDQGATWTHVEGPFNYDWVRCFLFAPYGDYYLGTTYGVFKSSDFGTTWTSFNHNIASMNVNALALIGGNRILAATWEGMYLYDPSTQQWSTYNDGLRHQSVLSMTMTKNGYVHLGSLGVYRSTQPLTSVDYKPLASPTTFHLFQNYPNPFNPSTTIKFEIPATCFVTLRVVDLLGREVTTLVNSEMPPGVYERRIQLDRSGTGVYFYRLEAGKYSYTRKMLLLK